MVSLCLLGLYFILSLHIHENMVRIKFVERIVEQSSNSLLNASVLIGY